MKLLLEKNKISHLIFFIILFTSFAFNIFNIASVDRFKNYDHFSECLITGKLAKAKHEGIFSHGGFPGINYDKTKTQNPESASFDEITSFLYSDIYGFGYKPYFEEINLPEGYYPYLSHIGGQAYIFAILDKVSPFSHRANYDLFKVLNALLLAVCLMMILGWINRNFSFTPTLVTFILILLSPWLHLFAGATGTLWWCIWSLFLPFIAMLLLLEKRHNGGNITNKKIYLTVFIAVFIKCFISGFEFITVPLVALFCPIVYYLFLEKKTFKSLLIFSVKIGIAAILAVILYSIILLTQLGLYYGSLSEATAYFFNSYEKRTATGFYSLEKTIYIITKTYLGGNAFDLGFLGNNKLPVYFAVLVAIISLICTIIVIRRNKVERKYLALVATTSFSIICPFSWHYIFRNHSLIHTDTNFIIWYIPTMILGFAVMGVGLNFSYNIINKKLKKRSNK